MLYVVRILEVAIDKPKNDVKNLDFSIERNLGQKRRQQPNIKELTRSTRQRNAAGTRAKRETR
jgi:hypothetical protein